MSNTGRVDKALFEADHYLGKPADATDLIIERRIRILKSISGFVGKDLQLLEIGCGNGVTLLNLAPEFANAIGLEYVEDHKIEYDQLKTQKGVTNSDFLQWDIMAAPYSPQVDRLFSFEVIEHLPEENGVGNYAESVKKGALCAFTVPNKWWIFETHGAKLPLLPWNRVPFFSWLPTFIHEKYANARIYTRSRTAPMDVVKWPPLRNFLRKYVFKNDTTRNPFLAVSIFVTAKKHI
jgi:SAM-dependent methyltransferase